MSNTQHPPEAGGRTQETKAMQPTAAVVLHPLQPSSGWSAHRRREAWFLLVVLLIGVSTVFALADGFAWHLGQTQIPRPGTSPAAIIAEESSHFLGDYGSRHVS